MSRDEVKVLLVAVSCTYPNYRLPDKTIALDIWTDVLEPYDKAPVMAALKVYISTNTSGFAPTPADLIEIIHSSLRDELGEGEAWALVSRALQNGIYGAEEEFNKLPAAVQKAVGSADRLRVWAMDDKYNESVISSNFMRAYQKVIERQREDAKIPLALKKQLMLVGGSNESDN